METAKLCIDLFVYSVDVGLGYWPYWLPVVTFLIGFLKDEIRRDLRHVLLYFADTLS